MASKSIKSLDMLFVEELRDLHSAERQISAALPKMVKAASSENLKEAFQQHLHQTQHQMERVEEILEKLGQKSKGVKCRGIEGIIAEGQERLKEDAEPSVKDAALISSAQRIEHYEIAGYGTARTFAQMLGNDEAAQVLEQILQEERQADEKLSQLATSEINVAAMSY